MYKSEGGDYTHTQDISSIHANIFKYNFHFIFSRELQSLRTWVLTRALVEVKG